ISVTVNDGGLRNNAVVRSFRVTARPHNCAPTLDPITDRTINENAGAQSVNLSGISSGASNQVQTLTVAATSSNPSLIATPTVNRSKERRVGKESLTPASSSHGEALMSGALSSVAS